MTNPIRLTFLGHSAWRIEHNDTDILIDPFITGNPLAVSEAEEFDPDYVILTHGHGDHLGDTVAIAKRSGATVITSFEVANYLKKHGVENVADLGIGGGRNFDFGRVKLTIAHHGSQAPDGTYMGSASGALLTIGGKKIYHAGDTALTYEMKLLGEMHEIEVALLPIGDNYTMDVDDAVKAVEFIRPRMVIPMHYDTFPLIEADPEKFRAKVEAMGIEAEILDPGDSIEIEAAEPTG